MPVLIGLVQDGLDLWAGTRAGLNLNRGGGGNGAGKLFLEVFAAVSAARRCPSRSPPPTTASSGRRSVSTVAQTARRSGAKCGRTWDRAAWESSYWQNLNACSNCSTRDPYGLVDGGASPGTAYQRSTMLPTKYMALVLRRIPAMADYSPDLHEEIVMEYADRVVSSGALTLPDECAPKGGTYGVDYGPDGQGGCIKGKRPGSRQPRDDGRRRGSRPAPQRLRRPDVGRLPLDPDSSPSRPIGASPCIFESNAVEGLGLSLTLHSGPVKLARVCGRPGVLAARRRASLFELKRGGADRAAAPHPPEGAYPLGGLAETQPSRPPSTAAPHWLPEGGL